MIATNEMAYKGNWDSVRKMVSRVKDYTTEEIAAIIPIWFFERAAKSFLAIISIKMVITNKSSFIMHSFEIYGLTNT